MNCIALFVFEFAIVMAPKGILKRPAAAGNDAPQYDMPLWETNASLAASLALVPLNPRNDLKEQEELKKNATPIGRELPLALLELKLNVTWNKNTMTAVPNYLASLAERGLDVEELMRKYKLAKSGGGKKEFAKQLCLCKDTADLKAVGKGTVVDTR